MNTADYNHLIMYAKRHYVHGDLMQDLKAIFGNRSMSNPEHITDADVWGNMVYAFKQHAKPHEIERWMDELFKPLPSDGLGFVWFAPNCPLTRAIQRMLGVLANMKVWDGKTKLIELGRPDPSILPVAVSQEQLDEWDKQGD